jgi:hypothetical protein
MDERQKYPPSSADVDERRHFQIRGPQSTTRPRESRSALGRSRQATRTGCLIDRPATVSRAERRDDTGIIAGKLPAR